MPQGVEYRTGAWLSVLRTYLAMSLGGHFAWEVVQLPLYTIFWTETPTRIAYAVLHCTVGDVLITLSTLIVSLVAIGSGRWPGDRKTYARVAGLSVALGVSYTAYSEWLNTSVRHAWSYAAAMPVVPPFGIGLSPLLQWLVIPVAAFVVTARICRISCDEWPEAPETTDTRVRASWKGTARD